MFSRNSSRELTRISANSTGIVRGYSRSFAAFAVAVLLGIAPMTAQSKGAGQSGARTLLPRAEEIALARSAAPAEVSRSATVWVLTHSGYVVAEKGTNGVACYVGRSWI